jgi:hypothetical protein
VDTDRTQALIGFLKANPKSLKNLSAAIDNNFASIVLSSLDGKPLAQSAKMLLTAGSRVSNTNMKWNDTRTRAANQGESPSLIEPVTGAVLLRDLSAATAVWLTALDGSGNPLGAPVQAKKTAAGWSLVIGTPVTTWYVVSVTRRAL